MHPTSRRTSRSRVFATLTISAVFIAGLSLAAGAGRAHAVETAAGAATPSARDTNLKALLQKRLLIPDIKSISLGAPSPALSLASGRAP